MPSEKIEEKGLCGAPLTGSRWKQGQSLRCKKRGATVNSYPRRDSIWSAINSFCKFCVHNPKGEYYEPDLEKKLGVKE